MTLPGARLPSGVRRWLSCFINVARHDERGRPHHALIDGPAVLGSEKWREIDSRYFGGVMGTGGKDGARKLIGARAKQ